MFDPRCRKRMGSTPSPVERRTGHPADMDGLIVIAVVILLAFGVAHGTFGRFHGTRGAISDGSAGRARRPWRLMCAWP